MKYLETRIPPPLITVLFGLLMWFIERLLPQLSLTNLGIEYGWPVTLALVLALTAVTLLIVSVLAFRAAQTTVSPHKPTQSSTLVTTGLFGYSRNPIYLAMLLALISWGLWLGNGARC